MKELEGNIVNNKESAKSKENLAIRFSGLTISGRSGTGKTVISELLAKRYFIPPERVIKTGQLIRQVTDSGQGVQTFIEREEYVDKEMDRMQREIIVSSTPAYPFSMEGRLAGVIASEEKTKEPSLKVVSLLFVARADLRYKRLQKRHLSRKEKAVNQAFAQMAPPEKMLELLENFKREREEMDLETVRNMERERETKDLERWRKLYPQLRGIDPFSTANKDAYGRPIYDFIIDTRPSIEEVVEQIHNTLKVNHIVIDREDFGPGKAGEISFRTVADGSTCEGYKDIQKKEMCDRISIGTLDVDISGNLEVFPFCSKSHSQQLRKSIKADLTRQGKYSVFGINGHGRA